VLQRRGGRRTMAPKGRGRTRAASAAPEMEGMRTAIRKEEVHPFLAIFSTVANV